MMYSIVTIVLLFGVAIACDTESLESSSLKTYSKCGRHNKSKKDSTSECAKEGETGVNEYPFIARLVKQNEMDVSQICSGTIITSKHILTSAGCVENEMPCQLTVIVGDHNYLKNDLHEEKYDVENIMIHENYIRKQYPFLIENDIAIVSLRKKINFNKAVGPVCMPSLPMTNNKTKTVQTIGWGGDVSDCSTSSSLRYVSLPAYECSVVGSSIMTQPMMSMLNYKNKLCLQANNNKELNQGGFGGPNVWFDKEANIYIILGINSYLVDRNGQNSPIHFGVSTMVSLYLDWIKRHTACTL